METLSDPHTGLSSGWRVIIALTVVAACLAAIIIPVAVHAHQKKVEECMLSYQFAGYSPADARALCD